MNRWIKADQSCYAQQNPWYGNSTCWYLTLSVKDFNEKYYNKEIYCNRILMNFLEGSINFAGLYAHLNSGGLTPSTLGDWCDYCSVFWWWLSIWSWAWATRRISQHPSWLFCTPRYRLCKPWQDDVHTSASTFVIKKWMNVGYIYIRIYIFIYVFNHIYGCLNVNSTCSGRQIPCFCQSLRCNVIKCLQRQKLRIHLSGHYWLIYIYIYVWFI